MYRLAGELGGLGLATTDLVNARGLIDGNQKTRQLIATCPEDSPFSVQIFGNEVSEMVEAAQILESKDVDSIDINMGCPVDRITKGGAGASMMKQGNQSVKLVQAIVDAVKLPVTVKMRLGWDETQLTAPTFAREFEQVGVAAVMIHGRTRAQGFGGTVDLDGIRQVVQAVEKIPVIGNGDVRSIADADRMLKVTGCHGVSVGRGALANPWIFRQLVQWEQTGRFDGAGSFDDRLVLMNRQFDFLEEFQGAHRAISMFRKMGHWYLKAMRVRPALRHKFQLAKSREDFDHVLEEISVAGPSRGSRSDLEFAVNISVPSGPIAHW